MTVGYSRVADLNSYFNNIYEDAVFAMREASVATRLVRTFTNGEGDQTRTLSQYSTVTVRSVAETEDYASPDRFSKSALGTLTPGEVMTQVLITDRRLETDPQDARGDAAREVAAAMADKVDTNLLSNFSSLTGGTVGASGSTMTWGYFFAAQSILRASKVPEPYVCLLHPLTSVAA